MIDNFALVCDFSLATMNSTVVNDVESSVYRYASVRFVVHKIDLCIGIIGFLFNILSFIWLRRLHMKKIIRWKHTHFTLTALVVDSLGSLAVASIGNRLNDFISFSSAKAHLSYSHLLRSFIILLMFKLVFT